MQMFGVGVLELLLIMLLTVIVVGPDKMPQLAADLGRWLRQTRAYARHLMGDFNEVISELEKESGATREDWKEIANLVKRNTGGVGQELTRFTREVEQQQKDLTDVKQLAADKPSNVVPIDPNATEPEDDTEALDAPVQVAVGESVRPDDQPEDEEEKPWYVPERASRRRSSE